MTPGSRWSVLLAALAVGIAAVLWRGIVETEARAPGIPTPLVPEAVIRETAEPGLAESEVSNARRAPAAVDDPGPADSVPASIAQVLRDESEPIHLMGSVTDSSGNLLRAPAWSVGLVSSNGSRSSTEAVEGKYRFDGLEPGEYVLGLPIHGYKDVERPIVLRPGEVTHVEDLCLEAAWMIRVVVRTPEGEDLRARLEKQDIAPLLALSIVASSAPPEERMSAYAGLFRESCLSRSNVSRIVGEERDDRIQVLTDPPIYVSVVVRDQVLATQRVETRVEDLVFTIGVDQLRALLADLVLRIEDGPTGRAATGAFVILTTAQSVERGIQPDDAGLVRYEGRVPGLYQVRVHMRGRAPEVRSVELEPGRTTDLGTITLTAGMRIAGKIVDGEGTPRKVEGSLLPLGASDAPDEGESRFVYGLNVDDEGRFSFDHPLQGRYLVRIQAAHSNEDGGESDSGWASPPVLVDTRDGPVEGLVIVVSRPAAVVFRPVSNDLTGTSYEILAPGELPCGQGAFGGLAAQRAALAPGSYTLRLLREKTVVREIPFTVGSSPITIDV